jgi:transcriptional regulator with XRE-family HTH domain
MTLTVEQLNALRAIPADTVPNRLRVAFALTDTRQVDACAATGISAARISDLVRGEYKSVSIDVCHALADFFGCAIEDLFPARQAVAS